MNSYSRSVLQTEFQDSLVDIRIQSDNFERFISPDREEIHYQLQKLDDFSLYYQNLYYQADDWLLNASEEQFSSINYSQAPLYICGFDQFFIHYLDDDFFSSIFSTNFIKNYSDSIKTNPRVWISANFANLFNLTIGDALNLTEGFYDSQSELNSLQQPISFCNFTIGGIFELRDINKFKDLIGIQYSHNFINPIFTIITSINWFSSNICNLSQNSRHIKFFDNIHLSRSDSLLFSQEVRSANRDIIYSVYHQSDFMIDFCLFDEIDSLYADLSKYQILYAIFSLPIFAISMKLIKIVFNYLNTKDKSDLAFLKVKGISYLNENLIKLIEIGILGASGGLLGLGIGNLVFQTVNTVFFRKTFYFLSISTKFHSQLFFSIFIGIILYIIGKLYAQKDFKSKSLDELLHKYEFTQETKANRERISPVFLFILGLIPFFEIILNYFAHTFHSFSFTTFVSIFNYISLIFSPIAPILLLYSSIILIIKGFQIATRESLSRVKIKNKNFLLHFAIKQFQRKNQKTIDTLLLLSLSLGFTLFSQSLQMSELDYQNQMNILDNGSGLASNIILQQPISFSDLNNQFLSKIAQQQEQLDFSEFAWQFPSNDFYFYNYTHRKSLSIQFISAEHYLKMIDFPHDWFTPQSTESVLTKLAQNNTTILIPDSWTKLYSIGQTLNISYISNSKNLSVECEIIGSYSRFPFLFGAKSNPPLCYTILMGENSVFLDICEISSFYLILQSNSPAPNSISSTLLNSLIYQHFPFSEIFQNEIQVYDFDLMIFNLLEIESFYFMGLVFFGILIVNLVKIQDNEYQWNLLRIKGLSKKRIFFIEQIQWMLFTTIACILSLIALISSQLMINMINFLFSDPGQLQRRLYINSQTILIDITFLIIISLCYLLLFYLKIKQIDAKSERLLKN